MIFINNQSINKSTESDIFMQDFGKYSVIKVSQDLSNGLMKEIKDRVNDGLKHYEYGVILDLKETKFISSEFLGLFFKLSGEAEKINKKFCICNMVNEVQKLFVLSGFTKHLLIETSLEEAISTLTNK